MNILERFFTSLSLAVGGEAVAAMVIVAFLAALLALYVAIRLFTKTEYYKQHKTQIDLLSGYISSIVWLLEFHDVDLTEYVKRANEREAAGLSYVDPRMLYLIDRAERYINTNLDLNLDFEDLLGLGEQIFDEIKHSPDNGVGETVVVAIEENPPAE